MYTRYVHISKYTSISQLLMESTCFTLHVCVGQPCTDEASTLLCTVLLTDEMSVLNNI